jgi:hypothetical protein
MFVIALYEQSVAIYNAQNGDLLEEKGKFEQSFSNPTIYFAMAVNYMSQDIILAANKASGKKPLCLVYGLTEVPYKEQIDDLFS